MHKPLYLLAISLCLQCTPSELKAAKTAIELTDNACLLLRGKVQDGDIKTVCATVNDLAPITQTLVDRLPSYPSDAGHD